MLSQDKEGGKVFQYLLVKVLKSFRRIMVPICSYNSVEKLQSKGRLCWSMFESCMGRNFPHPCFCPKLEETPSKGLLHGQDPLHHSPLNKGDRLSQKHFAQANLAA